MDVFVHYWAGPVKIRKFETSEIKILPYTCMYYKIVVNLRTEIDVTY